MKKKSVLLLNVLLLIFTGCSSDDEVVNGVRNGEKERGGFVYEGYTQQEIDESDPLSVFFGEELHNPYWDSYGNEHKTFFEQGQWNDESILVINSQEEFQKAYMGTKNRIRRFLPVNRRTLSQKNDRGFFFKNN